MCDLHRSEATPPRPPGKRKHLNALFNASSHPGCEFSFQEKEHPLISLVTAWTGSWCFKLHCEERCVHLTVTEGVSSLRDFYNTLQRDNLFSYRERERERE